MDECKPLPMSTAPDSTSMPMSMALAREFRRGLGASTRPLLSSTSAVFVALMYRQHPSRSSKSAHVRPKSGRVSDKNGGEVDGCKALP
jgi:hypothetical protein